MEISAAQQMEFVAMKRSIVHTDAKVNTEIAGYVISRSHDQSTMLVQNCTVKV